ncbi:DUF3800 domain-containing protein [Mycoplasma tauri]|uniref:DUF3800 domain-containing protein n=1 Tax=Mycoplasma tauri TaxID=547987 RepID=UPI001CC0CA69|nr:DUF3800 domain-containing protein [Mycoplasma tauri]MBZ4218278.1 DUF3800 domain-containing protein [Mycoplasma tauri]
MDIYVYSDESGVFDKKHNDFFVFAGLIFIGKKSKDEKSRMYKKAEDSLKKIESIKPDQEVKASKISIKGKNKLFRSLNNFYKFGIVIAQKELLDQIFTNKKDKQRYLDFAYKIAVKRALQQLIRKKIIFPDQVENIHFFIDEHTTATNGRYELEEALESEFKRGTYNANWNKYYEPIFYSLKDVKLEFCNSKSKLLVRASDIIANKIFYLVNNNKFEEISRINNLFFCKLP